MELYVTDAANNRVCSFNDNGQYITSFGSIGSNLGQFNTPFGIAVSRKSGQIYTTELPTTGCSAGDRITRNLTHRRVAASNQTFFMRNTNTTGMADYHRFPVVVGAEHRCPGGGRTGTAMVTNTVGITGIGSILLRDSTRSATRLQRGVGQPRRHPIVGDWTAMGKMASALPTLPAACSTQKRLTSGFAEFTMVSASRGYRAGRRLERRRAGQSRRIPTSCRVSS